MNRPEDERPLFAKSIYMYLIDIFFYVKMAISNLIPAKVLILTRINSLLWQEFLRD